MTGETGDPASTKPIRTTRRRDALGLATFVALGLPDGMLGTAWPSMRHTLHAAVGDLGLVLVAYTVGAVAITSVVGRLVRRRGVELLLASSCALAVGAACVVATAPALVAVVAGGLAFGLAGGAMDSGLNSAVGLAGRGRLLNLLHAFYGVGTMIGPLVVTAATVTGSWRTAYVALAVVDILLAVVWLATRWSTRPPGPNTAAPGPEGVLPPRPTRRHKRARPSAGAPSRPASPSSSSTPASRCRPASGKPPSPGIASTSPCRPPAWPRSVTGPP